MKAFKILLIEEDPGDLCLFRELIAELDLLPYWRLWKRSLELLIIDLVEDAIELLKTEQVDLVLFSLTPSAGRGFSDFLALYAEASDVPCVVIADRQDETLALAAVREGAQDYLLKAEVDCASLARALRYSVEKHRMAVALRSLSPTDDLTGLYQRGAFLALVDHDLQIIASVGKKALLLVVRFDGIEDIEARENRELLLLDLAETLRDGLPQPALAGRTAEYDFAFLIADAGGKPSPEQRLRNIIESWKCASRHAVSERIAALASDTGAGEELLACAESLLCETKAYPLIGPQ